MKAMKVMQTKAPMKAMPVMKKTAVMKAMIPMKVLKKKALKVNFSLLRDPSFFFSEEGGQE